MAIKDTTGTVSEQMGTITLVPVDLNLRKRLWTGVTGALIFLVVALVQGVSRAGFDNWQQSLSALSLGPNGWIQSLNFAAMGLVVIYTCPAWKNILAGHKGAKAFVILLHFTGICLILCALFNQDPAPGYDPEQLQLKNPTLYGLLLLLFSAIGALSSIGCLIIAALSFFQEKLWAGWKLYTIGMALLMTACIIIYAIWSTKATGFAGLFERIGLMILPAWALTFTLRLDKGVPFMILKMPEKHSSEQ